MHGISILYIFLCKIFCIFCYATNICRLHHVDTTPLSQLFENNNTATLRASPSLYFLVLFSTKVNFLDVEAADTTQDALRPTTAAGVKMAQIATPTAPANQGTAVGVVSEQDYINMLMTSPLFQQIEELQGMLDKQSGVSSSHVTG